MFVSVGKVSTISSRRIKGDISRGEVNRHKQLRKGLHRLNIQRERLRHAQQFDVYFCHLCFMTNTKMRNMTNTGGKYVGVGGWVS